MNTHKLLFLLLISSTSLVSAETNIEYHSTTSFKDVVGRDDAKQCFKQVIEKLKNPSNKEQHTIGYIITGESRTGKSYFVEALGNEIENVLKKENSKFACFTVTLRYIKELGGIKQFITKIKQNAPCLIHIDEIDLLLCQTYFNQSMQQLRELFDFMQQPISDDPNKQIIIIVTPVGSNPNGMNAPDGEFKKLVTEYKDRITHFHFERPNLQERKEFLAKILKRHTK